MVTTGENCRTMKRSRGQKQHGLAESQLRVGLVSRLQLFRSINADFGNCLFRIDVEVHAGAVFEHFGRRQKGERSASARDVE